MLVHCFIWLSARVLNSNLNLNSNSFELRGKRKEKRNRKRNPKPKPRNSAQHPTPPFSRTARPNPTGPLFSPLSATAHSLTPSPRAAQFASAHATRSLGPNARPRKHPVPRRRPLARRRPDPPVPPASAHAHSPRAPSTTASPGPLARSIFPGRAMAALQQLSAISAGISPGHTSPRSPGL